MYNRYSFNPLINGQSAPKYHQFPLNPVSPTLVQNARKLVDFYMVAAVNQRIHVSKTSSSSGNV